MRNREKQAIRGHFGSDREFVCIFGQDAVVKFGWESCAYPKLRFLSSWD